MRLILSRFDFPDTRTNSWLLNFVCILIFRARYFPDFISLFIFAPMYLSIKHIWLWMIRVDYEAYLVSVQLPDTRINNRQINLIFGQILQVSFCWFDFLDVKINYRQLNLPFTRFSTVKNSECKFRRHVHTSHRTHTFLT